MAIKEKAQSAIVDGAKKLLKRYGWGFILEWTPFIGFLVPGNVILVYRELKGDLTSPEGIIMMPIALLGYLITLIMGIIEIWFDLGIITTLVTWMIGAFFAVWLWSRGSSSNAKADDENKEDKSTVTPQKTSKDSRASEKNQMAA